MDFEDKMILSYEEHREIEEISADKMANKQAYEVATVVFANHLARVNKAEMKLWDSVVKSRNLDPEKHWIIKRIGSFSVVVEKVREDQT